MIRLLARLFIKDRGNTEDPGVRQAYGSLCGILGMILNLILFGLKFLAGTISGSIAIRADAFNNLSDAGSSLISLVGFRLAGKAPDPDHPFGHGRMEYIAGLVVSALILIMGFDLAKSSMEKILHPETVTFSWLSCGILALSILVKLYMAYYNRSTGKRIHSPALLATAADSLSDTVSTAVVLASTLIAKWSGWHIDAYCGAAVSLFILYAGIHAASETLQPLLGTPPEKAFIGQVESIVRSYDQISGMHDLIVHDYGPGRCMLSLHAEVPADGDLLELHDMIDNLERRLKAELHCEAVVHMDPIQTADAQIGHLRQQLAEAAKAVDGALTVHDLRVVPGPTHTNVIFDIVVPAGFAMQDAALTEAMQQAVRAMDVRYYAVIHVDHAFY